MSAADVLYSHIYSARLSVTTGHYQLQFYLSVVDESVEALVLPLFWADDCRWESTAVSPLALGSTVEP